MPGLFGIPFNLSLVYLTRADLAKMRAGLMDPAGKTLTSAAKKWSIEGLTLSLVGTIFWGGFVLILLWHSPR